MWCQCYGRSFCRKQVASRRPPRPPSCQRWENFLFNSIGVTVTRRTVTSALRREGLCRRRARKTPLPKKKQLCARTQFATEMLNKEDNLFSKILWSDCLLFLFERFSFVDQVYGIFAWNDMQTFFVNSFDAFWYKQLRLGSVRLGEIRFIIWLNLSS